MSASPRKCLQHNANVILEATSEKISIHDLYLVLKATGLTTKNIFYLDVAITNLSKTCSLDSNHFFSDINAAVSQVLACNKRKEFLSEFSQKVHSHKSKQFLIQDKLFDLNPIYGIFAGLNPDIFNHLSLNFDQKKLTYHPILAFGLQCLVVINKVHTIDEKFVGLPTFCDNLKSLIINESWKDTFTQLIENISSELERTKTPLSLNQFFSYIETHFEVFDFLTEPQKSLIKKLLELKHYLNDYLFPNVDDYEVSQEKQDLDLVQVDLPEQSNTVEIYTKAVIPEEEEDEELEQKSNLFLATVGQHRKERDAQNILFTNPTLLPNEIALIESSIHAQPTSDEDTLKLKKTQLCWALMLYYAIPTERIPKILIGTPELDHSREDMANRIVIDLENNTIFLPTPMQSLHRETAEQFKHLHLPLPLEQTVKTRLSEILGTQLNTTSLSNLIDSGTLKSAKSFKKMPGFRQYRITAGKVALTLSHHLFSASHDEVKTAYLQGGSYKFEHMGCYYTTLAIQDLIDLYIQTCQQVFAHHCLPVTSVISGKIGSLRTPEVDEVHQFLSSKRLILEKLKKEMKTPEQFWSFHNELTLYTVTLLNLSAAHRPNDDPYYSVLNFIEERFVQITEKVVMRGFEGRIAVLHSFSFEQYKAYLKHLKNLMSSLPSDLKSPTKQMLHGLIQGEQNPRKGVPLFFLIIDGQLKNMSKKALSDYYCSHPDIKLEVNFYRHLLSTELSKLNVPRLLIATQMGHISKGLEPFSKTSLLSPTSFLEQFTVYLDQYLKRIEPLTVMPPHVMKYRNTHIKDFSWQPSLLGPFKREQARAVKLDAELIQKIDQSLKDNGVDTCKPKLYVTIKVQNKYLEWIKPLRIRRPQKTLFEYYLHKQRLFEWKIENTTPLAKSPFEKTYGINYKIGKDYYQQIIDYSHSYLSGQIDLTSKHQRIIIALSALISGAISHKDHLIDISNRNPSEYLDIGVSLSIDLKDSNNNKRTWILNSLSSALLNKSALIPDLISERDFDLFLSKIFKFQTLSKLITRIRNYLLLTTPSLIFHYVDSIHTQSSIGGYGYQEMMGNYSHKNKACNSLPLSQDSAYLKLTGYPKDPNLQKKLYELSTLLSQHKINGYGYTESLQEVTQWETQAIEADEFSFAAMLLVGWLKKELQQKKIKVSSIATYFSTTYKVIGQSFKSFETVDQLEIEELKKDIYPKIINDILKVRNNPKAESPTAALTSFHNFIAGAFGLDYLHFSQKKIKTISNMQPILLEPEYQSCLYAIDKSPDYDEATKTCLKIALTLYKRLGLRLMEVFHLRSENICLISKTIHSSGSRKKAQKSADGNRLLPYNILLNQGELELLERWAVLVQSKSNQKYFLFGKNIEKQTLNTVASKVSNYLTQLIRSVANNPTLSIKSLRKSFASEAFLSLILFENHALVLGTTQLHQIKTDRVIRDSFNLRQPHNLSWLLASWMGHSTPITTFEYYCLSLDLVAFSFLESRFEASSNYLSILKSFNSDKPLSPSIYKNLNRFKDNKFIKLYITQLSRNQVVPLKHYTPHYDELFTISLEHETLQDILTLSTQGADESTIDKTQFLTKTTAKKVIQCAKKLLQTASSDSLSEPLFNKAIKILSWRHLGDKGSKARVPLITKQMMANAFNLKSDEIDQLFNLWKKQLKMNYFERGELFFSTLDNLEEFLTIYRSFNAHSVHNGHLLINVSGIKNSEDAPIKVSADDYLVFQDTRIQQTDAFEYSQYTLRLSFRDKEAQKIATCPFGLNSSIFFAKLNHELTTD